MTRPRMTTITRTALSILSAGCMTQSDFCRAITCC